MTRDVELDFGWGRNPFHKQLGVEQSPALEHMDKDAEAIIRLHIRGLIPDSVRDMAIKKAIKRAGLS
jgi:hypothetical protein